LAAQRRNRLEVHCAPELGSMTSDPVKVRQCLLNLLGNANKFTEGGTVSLQVQPRNDPGKPPGVDFVVRDTGIGMSPEQRARLFQPFSQADAATSRKYGGTGLGLAISLRFAEMMAGSIQVESNLGQGSTFTLFLPLAPAAPPVDADRSEAAGPSLASDPDLPRVLVIDDDPQVHRLLGRMLAGEGVSVVCASSGEEGLRLARELLPAVITLDVMMPGSDGWTVLAALKAEPRLAAIPVVMLSIVGEKDIGFSLGASEYLLKPIDRPQLLASLRRYLPSSNATSILVVDDDPQIRGLVRRILEAEKWVVSEAADGRAALESLERHVPSVILLDLMLPEVDGFEFLARRRENPAWSQVPVIVMTAKDLSEPERSRLRWNVERVLQKGAHFQADLVREIRQYLGVTSNLNPSPRTESDHRTRPAT